MRYLLLTLLLWPCFVIGQTYAGGLQSLRSPQLLISSQEITLNIDQVKVTSIYTNIAEKDLNETLVFALPAKSDDNFKQFTILVNQVPVQYQIIQHAISATGRDISKDLKGLGLPFNPIAAMHSIDASPNRDSLISKLRTLQVIDQKEDTPTWTVNTYYFWQQNFPAHSNITIEQTYKPTVTTRTVNFKSFAALLKLPVKAVKKVWNVAVHWTLSDDAPVVNLQEQFEKYWPNIHNFCPTKQDYQVLVTAYKKHPNKKPVVELKELNFAYAATEVWANPVNHFNLTIESPKNMHAILCWSDALKRGSNNALQFAAENYVPLQNISVLYIEK